MKKISVFLLIAFFLLSAASCTAGKKPEEPGQPQQTAPEGYEIKCRAYKEVVTPTPAPTESGEEYMEMVDVRLSAPVSLDKLIDSSYSIATAKLLDVTQDDSIYCIRYYDFEIEECIKGNVDDLPIVRLKIYDYAFGETSTFIINKDDGYVPPYELGGRYLLFLSKIQNIYSKTEKTSYQLNMTAFSLLERDKITELMQQAQPFKGDYPKDIDSFKDKIASLLENPEENGEVIGSDFIESKDIKEVTDFSPVIIEVRKKSLIDNKSSALMDIYDMELVKIHKGELAKSAEILANADDILENPEQYLLFLVTPESGSCHYLPASPEGSVIPVSDTERYNEAMGYLYPEEKKQGLLARIWEFIKKLFDAR